MSDAKNYILNNAIEVIEKFGGIRPMATKLGVAPTTVQGWKKRNSIPEGRVGEILKAANENEIQLSETVIAEHKAQEIIVKKEQTASKDQPQTPQIDKISEKETKKSRTEDIQLAEQKISQADATEIQKLKQASEDSRLINEGLKQDEEIPKMKMGPWIMMAFLVTALIVALVLFWPQKDQFIAQLQNNSIFTGQSSAPVPQSQLTDLMQPASVEHKGGTETEFNALDPKSMNERLNAIEAQLGQIITSAQLQEIMSRFEQIESEIDGAEQMDRAAGQLSGIIESLEGRMDLLEEALVIARENSTTLGLTFQDLPDQDLKPAAVLLGITQLQAALKAGNLPFEEEIGLLHGLVGENNPDLKRALEVLAPYANTGIETPEMLASSFTDASERILAASLKGESVSLRDQAEAGLSQVLTIKKDGQQISGTQTERILASAADAINRGDLSGTLRSLKGLDGPAAIQANAFENKLEAAIAADTVMRAISQFLGQTSNRVNTNFRDLNLEP